MKFKDYMLLNDYLRDTQSAAREEVFNYIMDNPQSFSPQAVSACKANNDILVSSDVNRYEVIVRSGDEVYEVEVPQKIIDAHMTSPWVTHIYNNAFLYYNVYVCNRVLNMIATQDPLIPSDVVESFTERYDDGTDKYTIVSIVDGSDDYQRILFGAIPQTFTGKRAPIFHFSLPAELFDQPGNPMGKEYLDALRAY